jgi:hypothetical protein
MQKKRSILKKMKSNSSKITENKTFSLLTILKSSAKFVLLYKNTFAVWFIINFILLYVFHLIPNGWKNSLSIIWLVGYYLFWSIFIRYTMQHPPYFSLIRIFNGLIPVSKIMFMNISIFILLIITQYVPLLMGFQDKYLEFFEKYMGVLQSYNGLPEKTLLYFFMILISPYTISRPYLAWISSLVGKSRSVMDAYKKTTGNYWNFVLCFTVMTALFVIAYYIDTIYNVNTLIFITSISSLYFNVVFINLYKSFYKRKTRSIK